MPGVWYQDTVVDRHFTHMLLDHQITNQITNQNPNLFSKIVPSSSYKLVFHTRVGQGLATQEEVTGSTVGSGSVIAVGGVAGGVVGLVAVGPTVVVTGS